MLESKVEQYLIAQVQWMGGLCIKFKGGDSGWPDRVILLPGGIVGFLELKAPGKKPKPLQLHRLEAIDALGIPAGWCDSFLGVDLFLSRLTTLDYIDGAARMPI